MLIGVDTWRNSFRSDAFWPLSAVVIDSCNDRARSTHVALEVVMRLAGNFHPEWGYLAPAPNVMRTARIVVVATAIGATAGAAVVLSLAERSAPGPVADAGKTLVVVHSLVQPAEAAAPGIAPVAATAPVAPAAPSAPAKLQASVRPSVPAPS